MSQKSIPLHAAKRELRKLAKTVTQPSAAPKEQAPPSDEAMFRDAMAGVKRLKQDKLAPAKPKSKQSLRHTQRTAQYRQQQASFEFSDGFEAVLPTQGALRYRRADVAQYELKQLRRGDFSPEMMLDLHGLTRQEAKLELAALIDTAVREHIDCVAIIHGHGSGVLKQATPHYLAQHPLVRAFHQAPLEYGGNGALLVRLQLPETD